MPNIQQQTTDSPLATFVFAHGAGAGQNSDFMNTMSELLLARRINLVRFDFDYMAMREVDGKKRPPARLEKLMAEYQQALAEVRQLTELPLYIGGKSMGGRVASHVSLEAEVSGVICLGYPFHPAGKPEKLRVEHLSEMSAPLCVIQGERDTLGNQQEVSEYSLPEGTSLTFLPDGDHSFKPRKASGHDWPGNLERAADAIAVFIQQHS